ncbi:MAG: ABC transporter substrate-binding protein [Microthrixaceae bacterium]|jgi:peptide/nickel transport system substrate-binding protein|nr:ABC transporter substrate-binding protein [Microthrixaceae bacterium]
MGRIARSAFGVIAVVPLLLTSCGGGGSDGANVDVPDLSADPVESGFNPDVKPTRGGQLVYGLEADTTTFCLPEAQLAISGIQIARAIFDPLVVPDGDGRYSPYLAKSVEASDDFKTWTIELRPGITFHDGSKLTAEVLKNNLDAYRGKYSSRAALLIAFVFEDIESVEVVGDLSVQVKTKVPWVAFPAALYSSGRIGIVAQAQLDASKEDCGLKPIGTGPFKLNDWQQGQSVKLIRNDKYWLKAPDGKPYPYVDSIDFRPISSDGSRVAALRSGEINIMHSSASADIARNLTRLSSDRAANMIVSDEYTETAYFMLNTTRGPFSEQATRVAAAQAIDREKLNEISNFGFPELASGPFASEVLGHLKDNGFPKYDPAAAKAYVDKLKASGGDTAFTLVSTNNPSTLGISILAKEMLEKAGFTVTVEVEEQVDLIQRAIDKDFDMMYFRNQPGDDPDSNQIWWSGASIVNFNGFQDQAIDDNLNEGRTVSSEKARREAYEAVNRRLGEQAYNIYLFFQPWAVAMAPNIHGVLGPDLPAGDPPSQRLVTGHPLIGLWIEGASQASTAE